jgi:hypothetical protein
MPSHDAVSNDWRALFANEVGAVSPILFAVLAGVLVKYLVGRLDRHGSAWAGIGLGVYVVGSLLVLAVLLARGLIWLLGDIASALPVEWIFIGAYLVLAAFAIGYAVGVHKR